jgi:hypothetical protein
VFSCSVRCRCCVFLLCSQGSPQWIISMLLEMILCASAADHQAAQGLMSERKAYSDGRTLRNAQESTSRKQAAYVPHSLTNSKTSQWQRWEGCLIPVEGFSGKGTRSCYPHPLLW